MKKFVIVGSGTAGLIAAAMIKTYWKDEVDISLYYDRNNKGVSVGESTTPFIHAFLSFSALGLWCNSQAVGCKYCFDSVCN